MELESFGERLAKLRLNRGVSAREMSLSIGQSANYINKIENRKAYPSMAMFFYICEYLGISQRDFFDEKIDDPVQVTELLQNLKKLDEKTLSYFNGILNEMLKE